MVSGNDPDHPAVEVRVTGFGVAAGAPRLSVRAFLEFGVVQDRGTRHARPGAA